MTDQNRIRGEDPRQAPYTYIELFDDSPVENLCASLLQPPAKLVVVAGGDQNAGLFLDAYQAVMKARGFDVPAEIAETDRNDYRAVAETIESVIRNEGRAGRGCALDLTGGDDLSLFAAGTVFASHPELQLHRYNVESGQILNPDGDAAGLDDEHLSPLGVGEFVRLCTGFLPDMDMQVRNPGSIPADFGALTRTAWEQCRKRGFWNEAAAALAAGEKLGRWERHISFWQAKGWVTSWDSETGTVAFADRHRQDLLTRSGLALEWKTFLTVKALCAPADGTGKPVYSDAAQSVVIYAGRDARGIPEENEIRNEIDVMAMDGLMPILISCKNGGFQSGELYKLNSVSDALGVKEIKKVVLSTRPITRDMGNRAKELGVVMRCVGNWEDEDWTREIRALKEAFPGDEAAEAAVI